LIFHPFLRKSAERDLEATEDWYELQRPGLGAEFREAPE